MQTAEQRPRAAPFLGMLELAELPDLTLDERLDADRVPGVETAQDRSAVRRDRRQHELQSGVVAERGGRLEGTIEHREDIIGSPAAWCPARRSSALTNHRDPSAPTASQW